MTPALPWLRATAAGALFAAASVTTAGAAESTAPAEPAAAFAAANAAFAKGDYPAAADQYQALAGTLPQADVYFNLGTAEANAGHVGRAIWAFEQALVLHPGDDDTLHNLDAVRQRALRKGLSEGGELRVILPGDDDVGTGLLTALTPNAVTAGFSLSWTLLFGLLIGLRVNRGRAGRETRQTVLTLGAVVVGLTALAFGALLGGRVLIVREANYGVVIADRGTVQAGPGDQYRPVARVMAGVKLRLRGDDGDWANVILPDGGSGWVRRTEIAALTSG